MQPTWAQPPYIVSTGTDVVTALPAIPSATLNSPGIVKSPGDARWQSPASNRFDLWCCGRRLFSEHACAEMAMAHSLLAQLGLPCYWLELRRREGDAEAQEEERAGNLRRRLSSSTGRSAEERRVSFFEPAHLGEEAQRRVGQCCCGSPRYRDQRPDGRVPVPALAEG